MEKARKWDQVVEYLEVSGVFVECDESIVMDVLKTGTFNHEKLENLSQLFEEIDYKLENVDEWMMKQVKKILGSRLSKGERTK